MIAALLFLAALVPRLATLALTRPSFYGVAWELSDDILVRGELGIQGTPRTDFEPLYPLFLAGARLMTRSALGVQVVQAAVAALGCVMLYGLASVLTGSRRVAIVAGLLYATYPLLISHSIDLGETALTVTLLLAFAWAFAIVTGIRGAAVAGACLGLVVLTRATMLPLLVIGFLVLLWKDRLPVAGAGAAPARGGG
jgi:hypothetical protein